MRDREREMGHIYHGMHCMWRSEVKSMEAILSFQPLHEVRNPARAIILA